MNKTILLAVSATGLLLSGCSNQPDKYDVNEWSSVANPASLYCVQRGAKLTTVTENNARVTYCEFSNDKRVEQWEYFRQNHNQSESANTAVKS